MKELRAVGFTIKRGSRGLKGNAYGWEVGGDLCPGKRKPQAVWS